MKNRLLARVLATLLLLVAGFGGAQAATYVGKWDPLFGSPYPNTGNSPLWFVIDAKLTAPDSCIPLVPGAVTVVCAGATFVYADVTLKSANQSITYSTLHFASALNSGIADLRFLNGVLVGVDAWTSTYLNGNVAGYLSDAFNLKFSGDPILKMRRPTSDCDDEDSSFSRISSRSVSCFRYFRNDTTTYPYSPTAGWVAVPEPGTVALIAVALVGMGLAGRRSSRRFNLLGR